MSGLVEPSDSTVSLMRFQVLSVPAYSLQGAGARFGVPIPTEMGEVIASEVSTEQNMYGNANMGTHMKTTIDIADALAELAKQVAAEEGTTLRSLVEEGLRRVLEERGGRHEFQLRKASFKGKGLRPEVKDGSWERIRDMAYEGRGG